MELLEDLVNKLRQSLGTKQNPARTCNDIYLNADKNTKSGSFWIDPNLGSTLDAVLVECKFTESEVKTCVPVHPSSRGVSLNILFLYLHFYFDTFFWVIIFVNQTC